MFYFIIQLPRQKTKNRLTTLTVDNVQKNWIFSAEGGNQTQQTSLIRTIQSHSSFITHHHITALVESKITVLFVIWQRP